MIFLKIIRSRFCTVVKNMSQGSVEKVENGGCGKVQSKKFPNSIPFILSNVFLERFCSGGIFGKSFFDGQ